MRKGNERDTARDLRGSALWGTGGRSGDSRSSALWGKGGRGLALVALVALALTVPVAATADGRHGSWQGNRQSSWGGRGGSGSWRGGLGPRGHYISPELRDKARNTPNARVRVIIQSADGTTSAEDAATGLGELKDVRSLGLVNGVSAEIPAGQVDKLATIPGISVTVDAPVKVTSWRMPAYTSGQLWPHANGDAYLWNPFVTAPTIAVVDSGVDPTRSDFGGRLIGNVNLSSLPSNTPGTDGFGHGTFVAGIAAGSAPGYAGAAPTAKILSLDVIDDHGMALTSDVIAACQWMIQHKDAYNIKVANFSLHSATPSNFIHDPLDQAVESLWFDGITVVAAAGNYGNADGTPSGVRYAPGNDPFVITVGALDLGTSALRSDDSVAPWSAYGYTYDGFWKPDVSAAGRYMVGPVPPNSTLPLERPDKVTAPGYMELSGTSFAAPVVSGTAADLLARHPSWTPDQVKGALMAGALPIPNAQPFQGGVGEINALRSTFMWNPPNPNLALDRFVVPDPTGGSIPVFDAVSWVDTATSDVSWSSVSWADVSWSSVSWSSVSWASVSWADVSWVDVATAAVSWADVSWADTTKEENVQASSAANDGVPLTAEAAAQLESDPDLNVDSSLVDPALGLLTGGSTSTSGDTTTTTSTDTTTTPTTTTTTTTTPTDTTTTPSTTTTTTTTSTYTSTTSSP